MIRNKHAKKKTGSKRLSCALCHMKRKIGTDEHDMSATHGYVCEWFGFRIAPDEINDPFSEQRTHCIAHGNYFNWVMPGVPAHEYAASKREQMEWVERLQAIRYAMWSVIIAIVSAIIAIPVFAS